MEYPLLDDFTGFICDTIFDDRDPFIWQAKNGVTKPSCLRLCQLA